MVKMDLLKLETNKRAFKVFTLAQIEDSTCDVAGLKKLAAQVCRPISDTVRQHSACSLDSLRLMLSLHESVVRATITGSPINESISRLNPDVKDDVITRNPAHSGVCTLPPVVRTAHVNIPKQRSSFPLTLRYPPILNTSLSPSVSRGSTHLTSPKRRNTPPGRDHVEISERHDALRRYIDEVDRHIRTLQVTFSTFTQRVLVPLQTFCKLQRGSGKLQQRDGERSKENTEENIVRSKTGDLHQSEMVIVQTMNRIRELLWPPQDGVSAELFSDSGLSKKIADEVVDCERFPVLRLLPDVLCKFGEVLQKSSFWLKRDILYTQNAKSALNRAHRRYVKTERLWQEARQSHRQLLGEWEHMNAEVHTNSTRLETLGHDIDMLREDLDRSQDQRRTLEIKLRTTSDNIDHLRARHRALRKRIIMLGTKIEQRERNYDFMESRVRSQRADQDAMQEKIRISEEYAGSLQSKMEQFYNSRAAWNRRYLEKSDPEILRTRLQSVQLRIPLPAVREKNFYPKVEA
uniref:Uncharacterized protein LOC100182455 n=1 Tax=Phallusia mammillata TaxID=59560 RepID=A0A6F9DIE7_9ASCI|nr:uncharacterized protein LOC100182455 [Phallusia mammillata]